jgi:hypothetical protein
MENIIQSKMTEQLAGATRREMRQLVDECVSTFSDRIENMHANFQKIDLVQTERQLLGHPYFTFIQQALSITVFYSKFLTIPPLPPNAISAPLVLESDTQRQLCSQNFKGILKTVKLVTLYKNLS